MIDIPKSLDYQTLQTAREDEMKRIMMRQMQDRQTGIIRSIKAEGEMGQRLRDMGLVPGTEITIKGRAPLYDPVALRVMGFTLTLRNNEADHIEVEVP